MNNQTQEALRMAIVALEASGGQFFDKEINACKEALSQEMYVHHPFCNADRRKQIGCSGCICMKAMDKGVVSQEQEPLGFIPASYKHNLMSNYDIYPIGALYRSKKRDDDIPLYLHPAPSQEQEPVALQQENEMLKMMLKSYAEEALEDISGWGAYAGDYFQGKWGLQEDLEKWKHRIELSVEQKIKNVSEALAQSHPAQPLSDDEINALEHNDFTCWGRDDLIIFARAIEKAIIEKNHV